MSADLNAGLPELFAPPRPGHPVPSPAHLERAYAWAQTEIDEWLAEADEEAAAIVDRARAEALRLELSGYEELERLREEAVRVRMATAERVARRLGEARTDADQMLASTGAEAGMILERARRIVGDLLDDVRTLRAETVEAGGSAGGGAEAFSSAAARLEALLQPAMAAAPGPSSLVIPQVGANGTAGPQFGRIRWGDLLADQIVMDDSVPCLAPAPFRPAAPLSPPARLSPSAPDPARLPVRQPGTLPLRTFGLPAVKYFPDDVAADRPARPGWRARLSRYLRSA